MDLINHWVNLRAGLGPRCRIVWPSRGSLTGHVAFKVLGAEIQWLGIQLLYEGYSTALRGSDWDENEKWRLIKSTQICVCGKVANKYYIWTHQIGKVVSILSRHEPRRVAEACDVLDVGLQSGRIGLQHNIDEGRQEVICRGWFILSDPDGVEDMLTAAGDASQLVPRHTLGIHLNDIYSRKETVLSDCSSKQHKNNTAKKCFADQPVIALTTLSDTSGISSSTGTHSIWMVTQCRALKNQHYLRG